jgi:hypothetical protein
VIVTPSSEWTGMLAFAPASVLMIAQAMASPAPSCLGPDINIAIVRYAVIKGSATIPDRVEVYANVSNVSDVSQTPGLTQHVELLREGRKIVSEPVRALRAREKYLVALRLFRNPAERKAPLDVVVRYVPDDRHARNENCNTTNDSLQKIF